MLLQYMGDQALQVGHLRQMVVLSVQMIHHDIMCTRREHRRKVVRQTVRMNLDKKLPELRLHISGMKYVH